jgi:tyrosyl-tRNA synthetase
MGFSGGTWIYQGFGWVGAPKVPIVIAAIANHVACRNRDQVRQMMLEKRIGVYVGFDPTANSLHIGHLIPLMPVFWMYLHGFPAYTLLGGATAKIGDPTGRTDSRPVMSSATHTMNLAKIHYQLKKLWSNLESRARGYGYDVDGWAQRRGVLHNGHWWNKLPMLEVLRRLGASTRMGRMLSQTTVKDRLQPGSTGMSFAEFSYPLMQTWDWWHLYSSLGVQMQVGGSDQYGNISAGADGARAIRDSEPDPAMRKEDTPLNDFAGFTTPLLTDSAGAKLGKSAGNALWLDAFETTPFDLYGYFVRRPDDEVERLLKLFTFLPSEQIAELMERQRADPPKRVAHHTLAFEVVWLVHGQQVAKDTQNEHTSRYSKATDSIENALKATGDEYETVKGQPTLLNNAPRIDMQLPRSLIEEGKIGRILYAARLASSRSEGHRLAVQKGIYIAGSPGQPAGRNKGITFGQIQFTPVSLWFPEDTKNFIIDDKYIILRKGKHNVRIIELVSDEEWKASGKTFPGEAYTGRLRMLRKEIAELEAELGEEASEAQDEEAEFDAKVNEATWEQAYTKEPSSESSESPGITFPPDVSKEVREAEERVETLKRKKAQRQNVK